MSDRCPLGYLFENVEIPRETLQRYIVMPSRKCSYPIHQKSGTDLPNALKAMGVSFSGPYVLVDEQKCAGMNSFEQNILFHIKI